VKSQTFLTQRLLRRYRAGFIVVRQRGSHIRLQKRTQTRIIKITVPAHKPVKKGTLTRIIKDAELTLEEFKKLL